MDEQTQPTPTEESAPTTEEQAPPTDAQPEAAEQPTPEAPAYDWRRALEDAPADEIRRHPKFAGILGSEKPRWMEEWAQTQQAKADAEARQKAEDTLREMARSNPVAFADQWLSQDEVKQQQERLSRLETNARQAIGTAIGAGMHAIPEWADVAADPAALAELAAALQGKDGDAVLPAWNAAALSLVAARRAEKLVEQRLAERLKAERQAWETEAAAQGLLRTGRPGLVRGGRLHTADPEPDERDLAAWNAWYRRNTPGAR